MRFYHHQHDAWRRKGFSNDYQNYASGVALVNLLPLVLLLSLVLSILVVINLNTVLYV